MRIAHKPICALVLAASCWMAGSGAVAQTTMPARSAHELTLVEGRGHLLQFQRDITTLVVSEPKIADAVVVSPREVMVNAKGPGPTTVVVWEGASEPVQYEVTVTKDNTEWDQFIKKLQRAAPALSVGERDARNHRAHGRGEERRRIQAHCRPGADPHQDGD